MRWAGPRWRSWRRRCATSATYSGGWADMVPRFARPGRSFSGVAKYLLHDAGHAKTSARVAWTHSLNCANDEPNAAIGEMIGLWRRAEALKAEAGIRGNPTSKPVKHLSLNWHPSEVPDKEAMITA